MMIVLAVPLVLTFLAGDCAHHKRGGGGQVSETNGDMEGARTGTWGGEHISLEVTAQGGQVEYDCAHGTIDQKIVSDARGRFDLRGTHVREHGGPVRKDETADSHPARFAGQIKGDTMTLTVTESDTKELVGTFTLVYGQRPHLMKCR
ncbi:MAG: hypothetical protein DMF66_18805 [Acidobacteria bacterium]|nr:MAG: hypothetical protein DMF66_18805 [Acidobacteriota bacterium]